VESQEVLRLVEAGYIRLADMPSILSVTKQRCQQLARDDFPEPAKLIASPRLWWAADVEQWRDMLPRVWTPAPHGSGE
jgi:hypothetical protein